MWMLGSIEKVSISYEEEKKGQNLYFEWKKLNEMKGTSFSKPQTLDCKKPTQQETRKGEEEGEKREVGGEQKSNHTSF